MKPLRRIFRLPLRSRRLARQDADHELAALVDERVDYLIARGMSREEARAEALRRLGGDLGEVQGDLRQSAERREQRLKLSDTVADLRTDTVFALRSLIKRSPAWTAVAVLTMALGVGATVTMLRIADTLLLRPIAYRDPSRVFVAYRAMTVGSTGYMPVPLGLVRNWRDHNRTLEDLAPFSRGNAPLVIGADTLMVSVAVVDTGFLRFTGAHPIIGQNLRSSRELWLSQGFWQRQYGASREAIGKVVQLAGDPYVIAGVVPATLALPDLNVARPDIWATFETDGYATGVAVRLRPGISSTVALRELETISAQEKIKLPVPGDLKWRLTLSRPEDDLTFRRALVMLTCAVVLLLLVACTNLTNLVLARGVARHQELAVRSSLGAGRPRLLRQLVTESVVLATLGASGAAVVGWLGVRLLAAARPANLVPLSHVSASFGMVWVALGLAVAAGLGIGVLTALRTAGRDVAETLQRRTASAPASGRLRRWLVAGEVGLSATLLVGALLLIHAVYNLRQARLGFDDRGLYEVSYFGPNMTARRTAVAADLRERAARIPGVERVSAAESVLPFIGRSAFVLSTFETPEAPAPPGAPRTVTAADAVDPDYFSVMGMPLVAGRTFDAGSPARNEVIVNRALAGQLWPDGEAVGRRFRNIVPRRALPIEPWQTVIGVAPDIVSDLLQGLAQPIMYRPLSDTSLGPISPVALIVRLNDRQIDLARDQLASLIEPGVPRPVVSSVRQSVNQSLAEPNFTMVVLGTFALLGVLLAAIGLFGVVSYSVGQRTHEIGVRMTLGATRGTIARLVVGDGVRPALIGIPAGLAGAVAGARIIQTMLYGVPRLDPFAYGIGAMVLLVVSVVACLAPTLRATAVDPVVAIRAE